MGRRSLEVEKSLFGESSGTVGDVRASAFGSSPTLRADTGRRRDRWPQVSRRRNVVVLGHHRDGVAKTSASAIATGRSRMNHAKRHDS